MSQQSIKRFLKISELYFRLTDKQYASFSTDTIKQLVVTKNEPASKTIEVRYRGYVAHISLAGAR